MCTFEVARKTWIRGRSAPWTASQAQATRRTASKSPGEAMGNPASMTSTFM